MTPGQQCFVTGIADRKGTLGRQDTIPQYWSLLSSARLTPPFHPSAICSHGPGTTRRRQLQAPCQALVYRENTKNEDYKAQCVQLL